MSATGERPKARYRAAQVGGCLDATVVRRSDRSTVLRSTEALREFPARLTDRLEHWARVAPDRTLVARRAADGGDWLRITYAQMLDRVQRVGQGLLERGLSIERPLAILSDNDVEHLTLALAAMWAGIPYTPVSPAYSLVSEDYAKLHHILGKVTPAMVFASGPEFGRAIRAVVAHDAHVVLTHGAVEGRVVTPFAALLEGTRGEQVDVAHAKVGPDTIAKFLFTSGSTKAPKGVINTQRMLCANQQMLAQAMPFLAAEPPVLVDWLPWNHTFGGNHNVGIVVYNGGTLYIDEGKPTARGMAVTLRNLREISPTIYFNVPKGFEELAAAMEHDAALRTTLFRHVKAFMFAGAGLSQAVWDQLDRLAEQTIGERIAVITGLGMTETAPSCTFAVRPDEVASGHIGLPVPGVDVKLVPDGTGPYAKTEIRFRGPNVTPGYWREPQLTAAAFDDEGYYITGDAVKWVDAANARKGLLFDGRTAEDFKLSTGTFVSVGPLRARIVAEGAPCVQDVVLTGLNRSEIGALVFPRLDECRKLCGVDEGTNATQVLGDPRVHEFFQELADRLWWAGSGSANRVARLYVMPDPPSIDKGEITDKGSLNQRAVLTHRAPLVEQLHAGTLDGVFLPRI